MFLSDPNDEPPLHIYPLVDTGSDVAVVRVPLLNEDLWWIEVRDDVLLREFEYGLEQDAEFGGADVLVEGTTQYDPIKVMAWCKKHIYPPTWKWFMWEDVRDDDRWDDDYVTHTLAISLIPRQGWWRGALVTMKNA